MESDSSIKTEPTEHAPLTQPTNPIKQEEFNNSFIQYTPENIVEQLEQSATPVSKVKQPVVEGTVPPRAYLDKTVVPTLLEGMKLLATERPSDPLAFLGHFLLSRSNEKQQ